MLRNICQYNLKYLITNMKYKQYNEMLAKRKRIEGYFSQKDFRAFVEQLIDSGWLNELEAEIAEQALKSGYANLTDQEKSVFDKILEDNTNKECKNCYGKILWSKMFETVENGGYCSECISSKKDRERMTLC